ncbi:unnamed protein product [Heterobilharzia americana]|nr:unnamed protein product [Heterobilharzia americana]
MSTLYYRPRTSELNSEAMDQGTNQGVLNDLMDGVPNYMQPDPMKVKSSSPTRQNKNDQIDSDANQPYSFQDFNENDDRLLDERSTMDTRPSEQTIEPTNWDWLRLNALGPGWEEVLKEVPVTRREALNLLVIIKKKLLRAASELTFYKERVTILQEQLIHQKRNEEKLIRLQAECKARSLDVERLRKQASRVPPLEKTVKQQEELICRLETLLDRRRKQIVNGNLSNYAVNMNALDNDLLDHLRNTSTGNPIMNSDDLVTLTALRNLSSENESLRRTVTELNRTVRNLAKQQQDSNEYHQRIEQKYREEIDALKEQQNRLEEQTLRRDRRLEPIENDNFRVTVSDNERSELYKMLDNAELRIKALEEELERHDLRAPRSTNE